MTRSSILRKEGATRVLLVQRKLPHYRVPLFNELARTPDLDLSLAIFTKPDTTDLVEFKIHHGSSYKRCGVWWTPGLRKISQNYDVVIVPFDVHEAGCLKLLLSSATAKKTILFGHSYGRRKSIRLLRRMLIRRAAATVVYTEEGKSRLTSEGVDENKVFVANNSIAVENSELQTDIDRTSFLFVGRLAERKQISSLIQAFAAVKSKLPNTVTIDIVGDGDHRKFLEAKVRQHDLASRIHFHGQVLCAEKLKSLFAKSIAYVSPGHVGLGLIHSFAYGIPVVTTEHDRHAPEYNHLRNGENGMLYDGTDVQLQSTLLSLCDQPNLSIQLGTNAFNYFSRELQLSNTVGGFRQAIDYCLTPSSGAIVK